MADLRAIYTATDRFSSAGMAPFAPLVGDDWAVLPLEADQPAHGRYRRALNPAFAPKAVAALDEKMRGAARGYARAMRERGGCDFLTAFALEFPIRIFLELMDMPQDMIGQFLAWENGLLHSSDLDTLRAATRAVVEYLTRTIDERKRRPGEDLISQAIAARVADNEGLDDRELLGVCFNLFIGGLDSVSANMSWQVFHLATHPDDQRRLRRDPALIPAAIDEMQRFYAAITTYRRCTKPFEVAGVVIEAGEFVAMSTTIAGRDEREYPDANVVKLDRKPHHVQFGFGPHTCLGMHLARREMKIALEELLANLPDFTLQPDRPILTLLHSTIQPDTLPIAWHSA